MMIRTTLLVTAAVALFACAFACSSTEAERTPVADKPTYTTESHVSRSVAFNRPEFEEDFEPYELEPAEEPVAMVEEPVEPEPDPEPEPEEEPEKKKSRYEQRREASAKTREEVIAGNPKDAVARLPSMGQEQDGLAESLGRIKERKAARAAMRDGIQFNDEDEIELGKGVAARILHATPELNDPALWEYVSYVGLILADHCERSALTYYFSVLDSDKVNAFSTPGGFVFITRGAVAFCENEAELAAILSHELAHIDLRHAIRSLDKSKYRLMAKDALREMDEHLPIKDNPDLKRLLEEMTAIGDDFYTRTQNPYNRDLEVEADNESLRILKSAGYNPFASLTLLERMKGGSGDVPKHARALSSHPCAEERIDTLKATMRKKSYRNRGILNEERFRKYVKK